MDAERWAAIEDLFARLVDEEPATRARRLEEECGDDPELRSAVESMLASHDEEPAYLEEPVARVSDFAAALDAPEGRRIGAYRLVRVLGRGGMGEVYLASQEGEGFERPVALKVIRPGMDTQEVLARFRMERRILAQLRHPNIALLLDAGATDDGRPFVAMEYVDGIPIDRYCDDQGLGMRERLALFRSVCAAVQHAHANLVLHRDLKPANILVTSAGEPKLLDFGIAKLVTPETATTAATSTGMRMLTPEYAAPEQVRGDPVSAATDVYGLGVLLFELLTGRRPHTREGEGWGELERAILTVDAPRPSSVLPESGGSLTRRRRRRLSGDLDTIVLKALRKEPERRYGSVAALSDDLERFLEDRPVHARPDTLTYRARKFARRNALPLGAASVVFASLVGVAWSNAVQADRMAAQRDEALEVRAFLLETFGGAGPDRAAGDSVTVRQLLDGQFETLEAAYGDQPELHSEMMMVLAEGYDRLGVLDRAAELAESALLRRTDSIAADPEDIAASMALLGWIRHQSGESEEAGVLLTDAVALLRDGDGRPQELSRALNDLGVVREALGEYDAAEGHYLDALEIRRDAVGEGHRSFAVTASNLSVIRYRKGDFAGAVAAATEALEAMRQSVGPDHQRSIVVQSNLAAMRVAMGDTRGAIGVYRDLLERQERLRGEDHPVTVGVLTALGSVLGNAAQWDEAEAVLRRVLAIQEVRLGADNPNIGPILLRLGQTQNGQGRAAEARETIERGLALVRSGVGEDHPRVAEGLEYLADAWTDDDPERAESLHEDALGIRVRVSGEGHPATGISRLRMGDRLRDWGRLDEALAHYSEASRVLAEGVSAGHPDLHRARVRVAATLWQLGRAAQADSALSAAERGFEAGGAAPELVARADSLAALLSNIPGGR